MPYKFPSDEWMQALKDKLNTDERYAQIARKWEGDILFQIEADDQIPDSSTFYLDLWHGKCRDSYLAVEEHLTELDPAYILSSTYGNFIRVLKGELDPMQAMITRKLRVKGSMAYMMRNVPVVLDFVRCAQEIESEFI
jgi:putative sterol carrier protein